MAEKIKLVQGDTRPQLIVSVTDKTTGAPFDFAAPTTVVRLKLRAAEAVTLKATLTFSKLAGCVLPSGAIDYSAPYDVPGAGGRLYLDWTADALDTAGDFEGELEATFADGTVQTVYDLIKFHIREQF